MYVCMCVCVCVCVCICMANKFRKKLMLKSKDQYKNNNKIVGSEMGFLITCKDGHELVNIDCRKSNLETCFSLEVYVALSVASFHWDFTCKKFNLQTHLRLDVNVALLVTKFIIMCYNNSTDFTGDCDERWLHFWRQSINCMPHQLCTLHSRLWCERVHNLIYLMSATQV